MLVAALLSLAITLQLPTLSIGDSAPPLNIAKWIKGPAVERYDPAKVYVIDFWAVWCGPCLAGMPHLTQIQKQYGSKVQVVGLTSFDNYGNSQQSVEKLVARKGATIGYSIAWDKPTEQKYLGIFQGESNAALMKGAGIKSFPTAVVVDNGGKIAYIGHPGGIDTALSKIVAGTWDLASEAARYKKLREAEKQCEEFQKLLDANELEAAYKLGHEISSGVAATDARLMLIVASAIVGSDNKPSRRDLPLAEFCAGRCVELTERRDTGMLDCLACVFYRQGKFAKAIETELAAIRLSEGEMKAAQMKNLAKYRKAAATRKAA